MRAIQYVKRGRFDLQHLPSDVRLNSKGEIEGENYIVRGGDLLVANGIKSTNGMEIINSTGDVNADAMGYQIVIDTLTYIKKQVTMQKFYEINFADYIPTAVGDGAFSASLLTNLTFSVADDFESGNVGTAVGGSKISEVDTTIASKSVPVINWVKGISYSIFDINQALVANNWDIIMGKEKSRMLNWKLGLQKIAFLGSKANSTNVAGLFNNGSVNINTSFITAPISSLNAAGFAAFVAGLIAAYSTNTAATETKPNRFVIPLSDWLALATPVPGTVTLLPMIDYLLLAFKKIAGDSFEIMPSAYADGANNKAFLGGNGKQIYALYRDDPESIRMDIPVNYTPTQPNSLNNFQFQNAAYAQYTGVGFYRNLETLLFQYSD